MAQAKTTVRHLQDVLASESRENREVDVNEGTGKRGPRRKPSKRPGLNSMLSRFSNHQAPSDRTCSGPSEPLEDWQEVSYRGESPAPEVPNSEDPGKDASRSQPEADMDSLDAAVQSLFHQAGVATVPDSQDALPVLVFTPANLPQSLSDPQKVISRLAYKLEPFVQDAYIAVVLSSPPSASLSSSLLVSAYLNLPRPARKNVKKIYVVHPGFWSKMLIKLFLNGIVSGKVGKRRKVQTIESLSALARVVDIRNMRIPLAVLQHNLKIESSISLPASEHGSDVVFGRPLVRLMGNQGQYGLPKVVSDCLHQLRSFGLQVEGIFRLSPPTSLLRILKDAYDRGQPISLATFHQQPSDERTTSSADAPAHLAAALLKLFLRSLPEPLISQKDYILIEKAPLATFNNGNETIAYLRERLLPHWQSQHSGQAKLLLLASILELLYEISLRATFNKMDSSNLALCLAPVLIKSDDLARDVRLCRVEVSPLKVPEEEASRKGAQTSSHQNTLGSLLSVMIGRYHEVFDVDPHAYFGSLAQNNDFDFPEHLPEHAAKQPPSTPLSPPQIPHSISFADSTNSLQPPGDTSLPSPSCSKTSPGWRKTTGETGHFTVRSVGQRSVTAPSVLSFGVASGKKSLKLMKSRKSEGSRSLAQVGSSRSANTSQSSVTVMGLFE